MSTDKNIKTKEVKAGSPPVIKQEDYDAQAMSNMEKKELVEMILNTGNDHGEYIIMENDYAKIMMQLIVNKIKGGLRYSLWLVRNGQECGRGENVYKPNQIAANTDIVKNFICNGIGYKYQDIGGKIAKAVEHIVKNDMMLEWNEAKKVKDYVVGSGKLNFEDIWEILKGFILENPTDKRIVQTEGNKNRIYVGIGSLDNNQTPLKCFKSIMEEIAPENKPKEIKDYFRYTQKFIHDANLMTRDCQKTFTGGLKMYCLNVDEEYIKLYIEAKAKKEEENNNRVNLNK